MISSFCLIWISSAGPLTTNNQWAVNQRFPTWGGNPKTPTSPDMVNMRPLWRIYGHLVPEPPVSSCRSLRRRSRQLSKVPQTSSQEPSNPTSQGYHEAKKEEQGQTERLDWRPAPPSLHMLVSHIQLACGFFQNGCSSSQEPPSMGLGGVEGVYVCTSVMLALKPASSVS